MRILGVDPGSRLTGYGVIDLEKGKLRHVAHGTLRLARTGGRQETPLEDRLLALYQGLSAVIADHRPEIMVVEKVFFAKNAVSALKLGQARGAVILTGMIRSVPVVEYSPSEVKQAVVGKGNADKEQVARMVALTLGLNALGFEQDREFATSDASDGLALAICHAHNSQTSVGRPSAFALALQSASGKRRKKKLSLAESLGITPGSAGTRPVKPGPRQG